MTALTWVSLAVGLSASVEDLARRRISNWIPVTAAAAGVGIHIYANGWKGALSAALGLTAGFFVFLIFYLLGGMGGGDVKLMAGFGAIVGIERLLPANAPAAWRAAAMNHMRTEHSTPEEVGRVASAAGVKQVVLSHVVPGLATDSEALYTDGVRKFYAGSVTLGRDLQEF